MPDPKLRSAAASTVAVETPLTSRLQTSKPKKSKQSIQVRDVKVAREDDPSSGSPDGPMKKGVRLEDGILYLPNVQAPDWREQFVSRGAREVYLEAMGKADGELAQEALQVRLALQDIPNLLQPVVVGPLSLLGEQSAEIFAENNIRTTPLAFDRYRDVLVEHEHEFGR